MDKAQYRGNEEQGNVSPCNYARNLSTAHAFYNAFTALGERSENHLHGEVVSFGTCVLYAFDGNLKALEEQVALNRKLGLPITLADLDITPESVDADLNIIVERAQKTNEWGRAPYGFTADRFRQAILDTNAYGQAVAADNKTAQAEALDAIVAHAPSVETAVPRKMQLKEAYGDYFTEDTFTVI